MLKLMRNVHIWNVNFSRKKFNINTSIYGYLYKMSCQSTNAALKRDKKDKVEKWLSKH
jgi:hypothetical protein